MCVYIFPKFILLAQPQQVRSVKSIDTYHVLLAMF